MAKIPDSITVQIETVDPDFVRTLVEEVGWPFEICFDVPERYIEPVAEYYKKQNYHTETLQEWVDAIRGELRAHRTGSKA